MQVNYRIKTHSPVLANGSLKIGKRKQEQRKQLRYARQASKLHQQTVQHMTKLCLMSSRNPWIYQGATSRGHAATARYTRTRTSRRASWRAHHSAGRTSALRPDAPTHRTSVPHLTHRTTTTTNSRRTHVCRQRSAKCVTNRVPYFQLAQFRAVPHTISLNGNENGPLRAQIRSSANILPPRWKRT